MFSSWGDKGVQCFDVLITNGDLLSYSKYRTFLILPQIPRALFLLVNLISNLMSASPGASVQAAPGAVLFVTCRGRRYALTGGM